MPMIAGVNFHEAAFIFPRMRSKDRRETKASIGHLGVLEPIVFVRRGGEKVYIDGINRREICLELGVPCPEEEYLVSDGKGGGRPPTDLEILDYVMAANKERRHLTSSQRAAIAVLAGDLQRGYRQKEQAGMRTTGNRARMAPADVELPASEVELAGDTAARVASMHGTNRAYLFKMVKVHEERPELTDEVRDGAKSVEAAYAEIMPDHAFAYLYDVLGKAVPAGRLAVFRDRPRFLRAQKAIRQALAELDYLATAPAGAYLQGGAAAVRAALDQALAGFRQNAPHSANCPRCGVGGRAKAGKGRKGFCALCGGRGWVDSSRWYQAGAAERAAITGEGAGNGSGHAKEVQ